MERRPRTRSRRLTAALSALLFSLMACGGGTVSVSSPEDEGVCREALSGGSSSSSASEDSAEQRGPQISGPETLSASELADLLGPLAAELQNSDEARFEASRASIDAAIEELRSAGPNGQQEAMERAFFLVNHLRALCTVDLLPESGTPS